MTPVLDKESGKVLKKLMWLHMVRVRVAVSYCGISAVPPDKVGHRYESLGRSSRVKIWKLELTHDCQLAGKVKRGHKSSGSPLSMVRTERQQPEMGQEAGEEGFHRETLVEGLATWLLCLWGQHDKWESGHGRAAFACEEQCPDASRLKAEGT